MPSVVSEAHDGPTKRDHDIFWSLSRANAIDAVDCEGLQLARLALPSRHGPTAREPAERGRFEQTATCATSPPSFPALPTTWS